MLNPTVQTVLLYDGYFSFKKRSKLRTRLSKVKNRDFDQLRVGIRKKSKQRKVALWPGPSYGAIRLALQPFLPRIFRIVPKKISIFLYSDMHTAWHVMSTVMLCHDVACHVMYCTVQCTVRCHVYSTVL